VDTGGVLVSDHAVTIRFRDNAGNIWERPRDMPGAQIEVQRGVGLPTVTQQPTEPA